MELRAGSKAVVIGLGRSGLAVVRYLHRCGLDVSVSESGPLESVHPETRDLLAGLDVRLETGGHSQDFLLDADLIVVSPGVPLDLAALHLARKRDIPVIGELELAAGRIDVPVIAVTGSNGKTTVTSLIATLLKADGRSVFLGGNIGTPLCEYLLDPGEAEIVVLELSSFQLETSRTFRPDVALLLNLSPDHLDRHGDMETYLGAKMQIFAAQRPGDRAILGDDDPLVAGQEIATGATVLRFGRGPRCHARIDGTTITLDLGDLSGGQEEYGLETTEMRTAVNLTNSAAAVLAARVVGCSAEGIRRGLTAFQPPMHRMTRVAVIDGVEFVNDSKATNIGAVQAALACHGRRVVLIAGGRNKGGDFRKLREAVGNHVKHMVLLGESVDDLVAALGDLVTWDRVDSIAAAVHRAAAVAVAGDTVLLAPGCASFDMFSSYAERGRMFTALVREMAGADGGPERPQHGAMSSMPEASVAARSRVGCGS